MHVTMQHKPFVLGENVQGRPQERVQKRFALRFSAGSESVASSPGDKTRLNGKILEPLFYLVTAPGRWKGDAKGAFAKFWADDAQGAINTFGRLVQEMIRLVKTRPGLGTTEVRLEKSQRLQHFLDFLIREDYWDQKQEAPARRAQISRFMREFNSTVGHRTEESRHNAIRKGLYPNRGQWREFIAFVHEQLQPVFREAYRTVSAQVPSEQRGKPRPVVVRYEID